jgi:hypothetical protein
MPTFRHALWIAVIALVAIAIANRVRFLRVLVNGAPAPVAPPAA